ncbi:MAG: hypothetical protein H6969_06565 [Gammaproteobacteria bacterium]|nr:hypothetical protein [Gammaproteobacteria bacterium]MCP5459987.1 hypothetical protein [Gammaproteobacteria bacterium]
MNKRIVYAVGFLGSIASLVGLPLIFVPANDSANADASQTQSGSGNIQAGRDIVIHNNDTPPTDPADRVPKFEGEIRSRDPSFVRFAEENDGKVVYLGAYVMTIDSQIDTTDFTTLDGELTDEFSYYYDCSNELPQALAAEDKESWDWRVYCQSAEIYIENPSGTQSIWGYRSGMYELRGYWSLSVPGTAMGAIVVSLSPVSIKDAY